MSAKAAFRDELVTRLKYLIDLRGGSVTSIERELGRSRGWLGDAFRGGKRLPLESILEVLAHLKVDPGEFFAGPIEEERRWGAYAGAPGRGRQAAGVDRVQEGRDANVAAEVRHLGDTVRSLIRILEDKRVLSEDDRARLAGRNRPR